MLQLFFETDRRVVLEPVDALEALLDVGLDPEGVLGLGEDLQQLVVGQEEEPVWRRKFSKKSGNTWLQSR